MRASTTRRSLLGAVALVCALVGPITVRAEVVSVPPAPPSSSAASLPLPTVLRGSPPSAANPFPICPPGYTLSPDYGSGCVGPSIGDYSEGSPDYDYWPDYGYDYPFGGFPGFGFGPGRLHRFAGFHGRHGFHGQAGFRGVARFGARSAGFGHTGGFGRR